MWFVPASEQSHGRVLFGWDSFPQGGVNDQGLYIGWAVTPYAGKPSPSKQHLPGSDTDNILARCATVEEAIAYWEKYSYALNPAHCMLADRTGASVVCEWIKGKLTLIRKSGPRQLITNFLLTNPALGNPCTPAAADNYPCPRFTAISKFWQKVEAPTEQNCVDALKLAANPETIYSEVYDLTHGEVYVYYRHNLEQSLRVNLAEELRKGPHQVFLKAAFADSTEELALPTFKPTTSMTASELLQKALAARGGADAAKNIRSIHAKGTMDIDYGWMAPSPVELFAMRPNRYLLTCQVESAVGLQLGWGGQGFDGRTRWDANPGAAPEHLKGKPLRDRQAYAGFFAWYDDPLLYKSVELLGEASFNSTPCYALKLVTRAGHETVHFYDKERLLLAGTMETLEMDKVGPTLWKTSLGEYHEFAGFELPTRIAEQSMLGSRVMRYQSIELNAVDPSDLKMPHTPL
jgi:choloylglycine hydrolase